MVQGPEQEGEIPPSELVVFVPPEQWDDGFGLTEAWKTVSANGVSERSLGYFQLSEAHQLMVLARVSTNCGNVSLSGKIGFERVGD